MAYIGTPIAAGTTAASNLTTATFYDESLLADKTNLSFQFVATSLDAADGVIKLQDSNNNVDWNDIAGATVTVASGSSSNMIRYTAFTSAFIRAVWTKNSVAAGTIKAIVNLS